MHLHVMRSRLFHMRTFQWVMTSNRPLNTVGTIVKTTIHTIVKTPILISARNTILTSILNMINTVSKAATTLIRILIATKTYLIRSRMRLFIRRYITHVAIWYVKLIKSH